MAALLKSLFFVFNITFLRNYRIKYYDYSGTSLLRSPTGLVKSDLNGEVPLLKGVICRAGTNTPSDEYDTYREYRVANTIRIANTLFLRG